jgi:predicted peroxiredoxin
MEQENTNYGNLFGTIDLLNEEHVEAILATMDNDHAIFYLIESVKLAHKKGCYSIGETEILSKAIRTLLK